MIFFNNYLLEIFSTIKSMDGEAYLVGGCVRDMLLGKTPKDFDIVTNISIYDLIPVFEANNWKISCTGVAMLVLNIYKRGNIFEIANYRKDSKTGDGRCPDFVEIGTIEDDAFRRDFTVNALYYNPWSGDILDPTGTGLKDLRNKILRFVGRPKERIVEDYLRIFRFYRFLAKGFKADSKSLKACREMFNEAYSKTTPERIRMEIEKMVI